MRRGGEPKSEEGIVGVLEVNELAPVTVSFVEVIAVKRLRFSRLRQKG